MRECQNLVGEFLVKVKNVVTGVRMVGRYYLQFLILLFYTKSVFYCISNEQCGK